MALRGHSESPAPGRREQRDVPLKTAGSLGENPENRLVMMTNWSRSTVHRQGFFFPFEGEDTLPSADATELNYAWR